MLLTMMVEAMMAEAMMVETMMAEAMEIGKKRKLKTQMIILLLQMMAQPKALRKKQKMNHLK
jgi:hypothetical protein